MTCVKRGAAGDLFLLLRAHFSANRELAIASLQNSNPNQRLKLPVRPRRRIKTVRMRTAPTGAISVPCCKQSSAADGIRN
jgi:hypothetical protein